MPGWQVIAWGVLMALPVSLPVTAAALVRTTPSHPGASAIAGLAYVGCVSMFLGFFAWYRGLAEAGVARASQLQLAQPLLTLAWSAPLLGERLGVAALLPAVAVGACVLLTQQARSVAPAVTRSELPAPGATARTRIRRHADRARHTREELYAVLDAGLVAHVAFVADGRPVVLPMGYARDGDVLLLHGSSRNRMLRALAAGRELGATGTLLDGLVLAGTAFTHSMNYRSAVVHGRAREIDDPAAKARALDRVVDFLIPGRSRELPAHTRQELAATLVLEVDLTETSVEVRSGGPKASPARDGAPAPWTGVVPLAVTRGEPEPVA
jgi:nitroimidazol reductase NimA-like FMN-containing flavoprotein (pyridoxamine 5'-phosphate oxidase superfamily)